MANILSRIERNTDVYLFLFFIRVSFHPWGLLISRQLELYYV